MTTSGLTNLAIGRFLISGILLQPVGTPDSHCPYAFYAENGYNCMLDMINVWDNSKVAYVGSGCITIGQYRSDNIAPLSVGSTGKIKTPLWGENVMDL